MRDHPAGDIAVIGGGVIGLSIAFELASRGANVTLYERGELGKEASWAAAGMLAPRTEQMADAAMRELCEASLARYPAFVERVVEASGVDPHLRLDGMLRPAFTNEALEFLTERACEVRASGYPASILERERALREEPALSARVCGALLVHGEGQIDNRRLMHALAAACEARGVRVRANAGTVALEADARRVLGVRTREGFAAAQVVVNAAGAWAGALPGAPAQTVAPVHAVKGEMLCISVPTGFLRHAIWAPECYLVPRGDGRLLVGATVRRSDSFDVRVTAGGMQTLLHGAVTACPALSDFTVSEAWAGLRPGTPDERPFLGPTSLTGYVLACGHYRNGILLAPQTAHLVADYVESGDVSALSEFSLERRSIPA